MEEMCARFTLRTSAQAVAEAFDIDEMPDAPPRFNIAPTQAVLGVVARKEGGRRLKYFHWGLVPSWAKDRSVGNRLINARAESLSEKSSFRNAFERRRCLIPADGFYEWMEVTEEASTEDLEPGQLNLFGDPVVAGKKQPKPKVKKQPFYIGLQDFSLFAFAGIWEFWRDPEGNPFESCAIITTPPNSLIAPMHDRMPAILHPGDYALWLDRSVPDVPEVHALLRPFPAEEMAAYPVATVVNNANNETPECVAPVEAS